jgi:hypothetical protein
MRGAGQPRGRVIPIFRVTLGRVLLAVASALFLACAGPQVPPPQKPVRGERPYRSLQLLDARDYSLNAHDAAGAAAQYAPDAEVVSAGGGAVRGREAIERDLRELFARCPSFSIDVLERTFSEEGRVVTGVERVRCRRGAESTQSVRYEIGDAGILRVWTRGVAPET